MSLLMSQVYTAVSFGAGSEAGWWRVNIAPNGFARWAKVDAPGDGPWITATTPPAPPAEWSPVESPAVRRGYGLA
jgi:hypothetical protein